MITLTINRCDNRYLCSVRGHSGAAPKGEDVVCAAVSALAYLIETAATSLDEEGALEAYYHSVTPGDAEFDFTVKERGAERAEFLADSVERLALEIEASYPGCISVT